jgi:hypothetical protein
MYRTIRFCEQGMIFTDTNIISRMNLSPTLTNNNVTCNNRFSTNTLNT